MPRLIDADALQEQIDNLCSDRNENWIGDEQKSYILHSDVSDIIFDAPTIEIPKVVHGYWIDMGDFESCSVCKSTQLKKFESMYGTAERVWTKTSYCPDCGAKMDLKSEEAN